MSENALFDRLCDDETCDICKIMTGNLKDRRDPEEGMSGPIYRMCDSCYQKMVASFLDESEIEEDEGDGWMNEESEFPDVIDDGDLNETPPPTWLEIAENQPELWKLFNNQFILNMRRAIDGQKWIMGESFIRPSSTSDWKVRFLLEITADGELVKMRTRIIPSLTANEDDSEWIDHDSINEALGYAVFEWIISSQ